MAWVAAMLLSEFGEADVAVARAGKPWVALYRVGTEVFATAVVCSHGQASLADGYLENGEIECPLHQGAFDVRTGLPTRSPCTIPVRSFPVRLEGNQVLVEVTDEEL